MINISRRIAKRMKWMIPFKSQKKQDRWVIFEIHRMKRRGFFVDLAATDGIGASNTYVLEKLFHWKGICIEPNPDYFSSLKRNRLCFVDDAVISDREEVVDFRVDNGQLGGIVAPDTDNNEQVRGEELGTAKTVRMRTQQLESVLDRYGAPRVIDYLSLDVEGSEERALRNFDFDRFQFTCLTIERPTPKVNQVLFDNGYVFVKNYKFDTFYVHKSIFGKHNVACEPFEQIEKKNW